jgi:hypothetical protein
MDLDTHVDNTVLSNSCLLIHDTRRKVDVLGFQPPSGAIAYDHPTTGKVYILICHQVIYCQQMDTHLMDPRGAPCTASTSTAGRLRDGSSG